jgi:CubicO group peptidase (beta-lactamase class C family)
VRDDLLKCISNNELINRKEIKMKKIPFILLLAATQKEGKQIKILIVLFLIISLCINTKGQVSGSSHLQFSISRLDSIDKLMENKVRSNSLAGVEYLIANKSEIIHHQTIGYRDIEKHDTLKKNSLFRISSATKPFTAVAVLILIDRGLVFLNDPISKYIPEFRDMKVLSKDSSQKFINVKREITIYDLLTYQSGIDFIREYYMKAGIFNPKIKSTLKENVLKISGMPLTHQPGEGFQYGIASEVLAYLVELVSKTQFNVFLRQNLFSPLEMYDTDYYVPDNKRNRFVSSYTFNEKEGKLQLDESAEDSKYIKEITFFSGGGGIVSTPTDYLIFARMLLNKGIWKDKRILSERSVALMTSNHLPDWLLGTDPSISNRGWGMGVWVANGNTTNIFPKGTYGKEGGNYTTLFWVDKRNELIGIIFLQTNESFSVIPDFIEMVYSEK